MYKYPGALTLVHSTGANGAYGMPRVPSAAARLVGSRIAHFRQQRVMTQDQLAVASSIDSSNIRSYESGRAMMNVKSLVRIAEALDVEPGELLDGVTSDIFGPRTALRDIRSGTP